MLRVEILGSGLSAGRNKYPKILEIFALRAGPSWFLIRSLKLISRYKYQLVFNFSTYELYLIKLSDNITLTPRRFRNHFLILILLYTTFCLYFKDCNIFQKACSLVRLKTLTFTSNKSNEIFLFLSTEIFVTSPVA